MNNKIKFKGRMGVFFNWPIIITAILAALNIGVYAYDVKSGFFVTVFIMLNAVISGIMYSINTPHIEREAVDFATQYSTVQKKLLNEFEIPYVLLDSAGKVMWLNEKFGEMTGVDKKYHKSIASLFPNITKEFLQKNVKATEIEVSFADKRYRVAIHRVNFESMLGENSEVEMEEDSEHMIAFYFFDETELNQYKLENIEQKQVAALVYIDNYDEALESIEDVKRSLLTALIDRKVSQYFSNVDGLVRKIEKDKYFVVFKYKYLQQLEEDKFSILEDVKTVKVGNEMAVTLSIGVGLKGDSYNDNYAYARSAIDLALGRGGDQAVVKVKGLIVGVLLTM